MARDGESRFLYQLAEHLGRTVGEILDLPAEELRGWSAYLEWKSRRR